MKPLPCYPDSELAAMGSWALVRTAQALVAAGAVEKSAWDFPCLTGVVLEKEQRWELSIDFRSQTFPRNHCACPLGKRQQFCVHALALYFHQRKNNTSRPARPTTPPGKTTPARSRSNPRAIHDATPLLQIDGSPQYLAIQVASSESPLRARAMDLLKRHGFQLDPGSRTWWLRDKHRVLTFLAEHGSALIDTWHAQLAPGFVQRTAHLHIARLVTDALEKPDGTFAFSARIDAAGIDEKTLHTVLARSQPYVETDQGSIVLLPPGLIRTLTELSQTVHAGGTAALSPRVERVVASHDLADLESTLESLAVPFTPPQTWRERSAALRNLSALQQAPASPELQDRLRLYQQIGAAWLWHLYRHQLGGILADEMGLGKTVQALAFLDALAGQKNDTAALVVCPAALVENWCREAARFSPNLAVHRHHGTTRADTLAAVPPGGVVITSYGTLTRDLPLFRERHWSVILADEAQHIKNRRSQNAQSLRTLHADGRFVLTGTPVENSLDDLRSLFAFLMPGYLPKPPADTARDQRLWYDTRTREKAAPYILRRTKQAVAPELPEKIEQTIYCELDGAQAELYRSWQERSRAEIFELEMSGAAEGRVRLAAFNHLLRLRQICAEPRLLAPELNATDSAKFRALREILDEALDDNHRILVFSQFVEVLRRLRDELTSAGVASCYIDGATRDRQAECDRFNNDPAIPIFLISLKAGGVGLNLTGADTVVHFDPWWNPAAEAQATDRAHRIGQTRTVTSLKLIAAGTVEERVLELQHAKSALLRDLFTDSENATATLNLSELKRLLD